MPGVMGIDKFLSHLCGDEDGRKIINDYVNFLSHLCGDEDWVQADPVDPEFLSHLCGDEGLLGIMVLILIVSKSPMR